MVVVGVVSTQLSQRTLQFSSTASTKQSSFGISHPTGSGSPLHVAVVDVVVIGVHVSHLTGHAVLSAWLVASSAVQEALANAPS